jgi:hypothetical protein
MKVIVYDSPYIGIDKVYYKIIEATKDSSLGGCDISAQELLDAGADEDAIGDDDFVYHFKSKYFTIFSE